MEVRKVGNINGHTGGNYAYQVYDSNGLSPTLTDMQGGADNHIRLRLRKWK